MTGYQYTPLKDKERMAQEKKLKQEMRDFCQMIGCSKVSANCPGSPQCEIVRKVMPWLRTAPPKLIRALK